MQSFAGKMNEFIIFFVLFWDLSLISFIYFIELERKDKCHRTNTDRSLKATPVSPIMPWGSKASTDLSSRSAKGAAAVSIGTITSWDSRR